MRARSRRRWSGLWRPRRRGVPGRALTCVEIVELLTDYLEGALEPARREAVETHLAGCTHCSLYLHQLRSAISAVGGLEQPALPEESRAALVEAFRTFSRS